MSNSRRRRTFADEESTSDSSSDHEEEEIVSAEKKVDAVVSTEPISDNKDNSDRQPKKNHKKREDPASVPRTGKFFLHDDRDGFASKGFRGKSGPPPRSNNKKSDDGLEWKHDKFEELLASEDKNKRKEFRKPKPQVPPATDVTQHSSRRENTKSVRNMDQIPSKPVPPSKPDENKSTRQNKPDDNKASYQEHKTQETRKKQNNIKFGKEDGKDDQRKTSTSEGKKAKAKIVDNTKTKPIRSVESESAIPAETGLEKKQLEVSQPQPHAQPQLQIPKPQVSATQSSFMIIAPPEKEDEDDRKSSKSPESPAQLNPSAREFQPSPMQSQPRPFVPKSNNAGPREVRNNARPNFNVHTTPSVIPPQDPSAVYNFPQDNYLGGVPPMHIYPPIPPTSAPYPMYDPSIMYVPDGSGAINNVTTQTPGAMWYSDPSTMYYNQPAQLNGMMPNVHQPKPYRRKPVVRDSPSNSGTSDVQAKEK